MSKKDKKVTKVSSKKSTVKRSPLTKSPAKAAPAAAEAVVAPKVAMPTVATPAVATAAATKVEAKAPAIDRQRLAAVIADVRSVDADRAREAAIELGNFNDVSSVEALISVLNNAEGYFHSVVRSAAAASLAQLGDVRAVDALIKTVDDEMAEASAEAVRALAVLGDARAIEKLAAVVRNVNGFYLPVVRLAAVHALARFNDARAKAELSYVIADQYEDNVIRDAAANAGR